MKKLVVLIFAVVSAVVVRAQERDRIEVDIMSQGGFGEFQTAEAIIGLRWNIFPRFFVRAQFDGSTAMFGDYKGPNYWRSNSAFGLSAGVDLWNFDRWGYLDVMAAAGRSVDNSNDNWSYSYYDIGANWNLPDERWPWIIGLGVRRHDSFNLLYKSQTAFYVKLGWKF